MKNTGERYVPEHDSLKDKRIDELPNCIDKLQNLVKARDHRISDLESVLYTIYESRGWKALEWMRLVRDRIFPPDTRRGQAYRTCIGASEFLLKYWSLVFFKEEGYKIHKILKGTGILKGITHNAYITDAHYRLWLHRHRLNLEERARMATEIGGFTCTPLISLLTPVYDTDKCWLRKTIESVMAQIYPHWELCLVNDASTKTHVRLILDEFAAMDSRIKVTHLSVNEGISSASNHALRLANGDFVGLLDHDDELAPEALFSVVKRLNEEPGLDLLYSDEDKLNQDGRRVEPFFKPDWSPDLLLSMNYIAHFCILRRSLLLEIGGFRARFEGSQDYDLLLRFTEKTEKIAHIPEVLYHWRKIRSSTAASTTTKPYAREAAKLALTDALRRRGREGLVEGIKTGRYMIRYRLNSRPLVSIIIPTRNKWQLLQQCLRSIEEKTSYTHYEISVIDNNSDEPETLKYLDALAERWPVYRYPGSFNFSAINNFGASKAKGDYLVFLNNDTHVMKAEWLTAMLEQGQRPDVGAVGAKLLYRDGRIQHAGVVLGIGGVAGHAFRYRPAKSISYFDFADVVRNCSAVTAACMLVPRSVFEKVEGFNERLSVAFNDIDFCLRLTQRGYLVIYTPLALLYHYESATRGKLHPPEDEELMQKLWGDLIRRGDPYYNPHLTLSRDDWSLRI